MAKKVTEEEKTEEVVVKVETKKEEVVQPMLMDLDCFLNLSLVSGYHRTYYLKHFGSKEKLETAQDWSKITKLPLPKLSN